MDTWTPGRASKFTMRAFFFLLALAGGSTGAQGETAAELVARAEQLAARGESQGAVELLDRALAIESLPLAYYHRGREHFRLGRIPAAVADFDRYVELQPERESRQWERGIALYYAGEFARGAKQFELYQTFHGNDVENSVWRYLCVAQADGVARARMTMLPIENDPRVPMMDIYRMFRGEATPEDVLAAARAGSPAPEPLAARLFYAHLYLGLHAEAHGRTEEARRYLTLAAAPTLATNPRLNGYMWDVARIHVARLEKK